MRAGLIIVFSKSGKKNIASTVLYDYRPNYDEHYTKIISSENKLESLKDIFHKKYPDHLVTSLKILWEQDSAFRKFVEENKEKIVADDKISGIEESAFPSDGTVAKIQKSDREYLICNINGRLRQLLKLIY